MLSGRFGARMARRTSLNYPTCDEHRLSRIITEVVDRSRPSAGSANYTRSDGRRRWNVELGMTHSLSRAACHPRPSITSRAHYNQPWLPARERSVISGRDAMCPSSVRRPSVRPFVRQLISSLASTLRTVASPLSSARPPRNFGLSTLNIV